jgi:transposase-like protein
MEEPAAGGRGLPLSVRRPRYEKVKVGHRIMSQGVLIESAVRAPDGFREIFGVEVTDTESEATYQDLFRSLKERGL